MIPQQPGSEPTRPHGQTIYDRAADRYRCGRLGNGPRCEVGPDWRGHCRSNECTPKYRRNWLVKRARLLLVLVGLCVIVAVLATPAHREAFAPGPLTHAHAQILNSGSTTNPNRCAACHETGRLPALAWITSFHQQSQQQHTLCLECHQRQMPDLARRLPHDLPKYALDDPEGDLPRLPGDFVALDGNRRVFRPSANASAVVSSPSQGLAGKTTPLVPWRQSDLACSDCHREHQGAGHDLQSMTNERCQSCHQSRFASFEKGHPEFRSYPYNRPVQLAFDHRRHRDLHYAKDNKAFDCRVCHVSQTDTGQVGQVFRSVAFEQACAQCHNASILASNADGLVLFQLPSIDKAKLGNSHPLIQTWPDEAGQIMDGKLPPLMQLLLLADPELQATFQQLGDAPIDFARIDLENLDQRTALIALLQGSQKLLKELADNGQATIRNRLAMGRWNQEPPLLVGTNSDMETRLGLRATNQSETQRQAALFEGLPPDLFRQALRSWFVPQRIPVSGMSSEKDATSGTLAPLSDTLLAETLQPSSNLLQPAHDDLLASSNRSTSRVADPRAPSEVKQDWTLRPLRPGQQLEAGGWMIDERRMAIVYVPNGHADPFVAAWTGLAKTLLQSQHMANNSEARLPALQHATLDLLSPKATGRCVECHQLNQDVQEVVSSAERGRLAGLETSLWRTQRRPASLRQATRFDHGPHLILPSLTDCIACHRLSPADATLPADSSASSPLVHHANGRGSEFESMNKADCASCHRANAAGDQCTLCHNYHVGEASWVWDRRAVPTYDPQIADGWRESLQRR